jgi:hypothetical protein
MPWIDTVKPHEPLVHSEYNKNDSSLNTWLTKGATDDNLRGYAIYRSETADLNIDSANAFQFIPYDPVADFQLQGDTGLPEKKYYYFATAISKTNTESKAVPISFSNFVTYH